MLPRYRPAVQARLLLDFITYNHQMSLLPPEYTNYTLATQAESSDFYLRPTLVEMLDASVVRTLSFLPPEAILLGFDLEDKLPVVMKHYNYPGEPDYVAAINPGPTLVYGEDPASQRSLLHTAAKAQRQIHNDPSTHQIMIFSSNPGAWSRFQGDKETYIYDLARAEIIESLFRELANWVHCYPSMPLKILVLIDGLDPNFDTDPDTLINLNHVLREGNASGVQTIVSTPTNDPQALIAKLTPFENYLVSGAGLDGLYGPTFHYHEHDRGWRQLWLPRIDI